MLFPAPLGYEAPKISILHCAEIGVDYPQEFFRNTPGELLGAYGTPLIAQLMLHALCPSESKPRGHVCHITLGDNVISTVPAIRYLRFCDLDRYESMLFTAAPWSQRSAYRTLTPGQYS